METVRCNNLNMHSNLVLAFVVVAVSARSVDNVPKAADVKAVGIQPALKPLPRNEQPGDVVIPQMGGGESKSVEVGPHVKAMWNMQGMSECMLHYTALVYNGYGCYCGFGGSGTPVDGIDECCMHHDNCYGEAIAKHGCTSSPLLYFDAYHWDCVDSQIHCRPGQSDCKEALCACDKQFTECQSKFPKPKHSAPCK